MSPEFGFSVSRPMRRQPVSFFLTRLKPRGCMWILWSPPGRKTQMVSLVTLYLVFRMRCRGSFCAHGWHLRSPHQKSIFCKRSEAEYEWGLQSSPGSSPVPLLGTSALRTRSTLFRPMCLFPGNARACTQSAYWRIKDRMGSCLQQVSLMMCAFS